MVKILKKVDFNLFFTFFLKILVPIVTETRVGGPRLVIEIRVGGPSLVIEIGVGGPRLVIETRPGSVTCH